MLTPPTIDCELKIPPHMTPPEGWIYDTAGMEYDYFWGHDDSDGYLLAKDYDLESPEPTLRTTMKAGGADYIFRSGKKYYFANLIECDVWEIKWPERLEDIIRVMKEESVGSLKTELLG